MNIYSFLSIIFGITNLYLGFFVFLKKPKSLQNIIFLTFSSLWAWWSFAYGILLVTTDYDQAWFLYKLGAIGWCNFPSFIFHFVLIFTREKKILKMYWIYPFIYIPGIFFSAYILSGYSLISSGLTLINGIWFEIPITTTAGILFFIDYLFLLLASVFFLIKMARNSELNREIKQARIIIISIFVTVIPVFFINHVQQWLDLHIVPAIAYYFDVIWLIGFTYSITRYKFLSLNTAFAVDTILAKMKDAIILLNSKMEIIQTNNELHLLLGFDTADLLGKHYTAIMPNIDDKFGEIKGSSNIISDIDIPFITRSGNEIPMRVHAAYLTDEFNDHLGYVVVGFDLRSTNKLKELNHELKVAYNDLKISQDVAARDLQLAINLQKDLFPNKLPHLNGWDIAYMNKPAAGISGDFFDIYYENNTLQGISLFDVSGHGISSGLITILAKSLAYKIFNAESSSGLNNIIEQFNLNLTQDIGNIDQYLTGIMLRINEERIEYVNAAHCDLLHRKGSDNKCSIINGNDKDIRGMFLGIEGMDSRYGSHTFTISTGDVLLLFTDALLESLNPSGEQYSIEMISESLEKAPSDNANDIMKYILSDFYNFTHTEKLHDDLTIIVLLKTKE